MALTQCSLKKGLQRYGSRAIEAVQAELQQLHKREVLKPVQVNTLTPAERTSALEYLTFIKLKRCGKVKARGCADGRKQRLYTAKEDASSSTVSLEGLLLSCMIDMAEHRDVATIDIPGAFMQAKMDEVIHMRLEGIMVELLLKLSHDTYAPFVTTNAQGKKVLYIRLMKALYETLRAALLFWQKVTSKLQEWGFSINP